MTSGLGLESLIDKTLKPVDLEYITKNTILWWAP